MTAPCCCPARGEEGAEVGEYGVITGGSVGVAEDCNHLEAFELEVVLVVKPSHGRLGECGVEAVAELSALCLVGVGGDEGV